MFIDNYLSDINRRLLHEKYRDDYLDNFDMDNFIDIYNLFIKYKFFFIQDIIVDYLEIFELDSEFVERKILELQNRFGKFFVNIISYDMRYLNIMLE